jgi:hypothetical protein
LFLVAADLEATLFYSMMANLALSAATATTRLAHWNIGCRAGTMLALSLLRLCRPTQPRERRIIFVRQNVIQERNKRVRGLICACNENGVQNEKHHVQPQLSNHYEDVYAQEMDNASAD